MAHSHSHQDHHASTGFRLALAGILTLVFVGFEAAAGLYANSLALLTDAAHNLTDALALGLSWYAHKLATRPSNANKTFGYHRAGILVALVNSTTLAFIAFGILHEVWERIVNPPPVAYDWLMSVGLAALVFNLLTAWLVSRGSEHDLNLHSAFIHLLGDVFSSFGAIAAGVGIWFTGKLWLDPAVSALIGVLILWNAWSILRETVVILLESTPEDIDMSQMVRDFLQVEGVLGVHDLHVWSLSRSLRMLSAHVLIQDIPISQANQIQQRIRVVMSEHYGINHCTLQMECEGCEPDVLYCDVAGHTHHHPHHD